MKMTAQLVLVLTACALAVPPLRALPDAEASAGRLVLRRHADAVVTVKGTVLWKMTVGDRPSPLPQENKVDVSGTVISPAGLTVTSLSAVDPRALFEAWRAKTAPPGVSVTLGQTEFKDLKLLLGDGTEIPARILWKDANRDLALIVPVDKASAGGRTFACLDLSTAPVSAQILGDYFDLSRTSEDMRRIPIVRPTTVVGIMERPRRLLLVTTESVGCPVFDVQGRVLGICLRFMVNGLPAGFVVVPSADVVDAASQAAEM